jgi:hypothetical protein
MGAFDGETMPTLTMDDLTIAHERLYVTALRYVRAFERDEIDHDDTDQRISIGNAVRTWSRRRRNTARRTNAPSRLAVSGTTELLCPHPACTGVHDNNHFSELCPRSRAAMRIKDSRYIYNDDTIIAGLLTTGFVVRRHRETMARLRRCLGRYGSSDGEVAQLLGVARAAREADYWKRAIDEETERFRTRREGNSGHPPEDRRHLRGPEWRDHRERGHRRDPEPRPAHLVSELVSRDGPRSQADGPDAPPMSQLTSGGSQDPVTA